MNLDRDEIRAAYFAVSAYRRAHALAGRPVPHRMHQLYARLDTAYRTPMSSTRHENDSGIGQSNVWIGTRTAAQMLGWHPRRIQRHAADLDGQLIGGRLVFPAASIEQYRKALQKNRIDQ